MILGSLPWPFLLSIILALLALCSVHNHQRSPFNLPVTQLCKRACCSTDVLPQGLREDTTQTSLHPQTRQPTAPLSPLAGGGTSASPEVRLLGSEHAR